jgi:hypothetical protein
MLHTGGMQTTEATIANPLGLPVEWRSPSPVQDYTDAAHVAEITASMKRDGWNGAPVVADYELREAGQDRAYTGTHRIAAWREAGHDELPCVYIEDLAEALGIDWAALMSEHRGDGYEAATALCYRAPAGVREAYGLDCGGA